MRRAVSRGKGMRGFVAGAAMAGLGVLGVSTVLLYPHTAHAQSSTAAPTAPSKAPSKVVYKASTRASSSQPIVYKNPPRSLIPEGRELFAEDCQTCHGPDAEGSSRAPDLQGLGAATIDFWVSTGRMPLALETTQAEIKSPRLTPQQQLAVSAYVASLAPGGPAIPYVNLALSNISKGESLFSEDCAACHTITGAGDALANNVYAPPLSTVTATQVAEAVRTGPGNMPRFGPGTLSNQEVDDIARYVLYTQHPEDRGGIALGHVGPVAEGFVAILIGLGSLMVAGYWIGGRAE